MKKINLLIADDHTLLRQTWSFIFNTDPTYNVVAECATGEEAVEQSRIYRPDVVTMDINLPGISGIEATALIRKYSPGTKILAVSFHAQPAYVRKMMQQGALGYVTKNSPREEMLHAVQEVYNGNKYICQEVKDILSEQMLDVNHEAGGFNSLSERELTVIGFIQKGASSKEIGAELFISTKTVEVHRYNILKKLNLRNAAALVNFMNKHAQAI